MKGKCFVVVVENFDAEAVFSVVLVAELRTRVLPVSLLESTSSLSKLWLLKLLLRLWLLVRLERLKPVQRRLVTSAESPVPPASRKI